MKKRLEVNNGRYFNKFNGITLISLVITVVVLIILASVGIYLSLSNNGIFIRAKQAKEATNKQTATEIINLKITNSQINKYAEKQEMPTLKELSEALKDDNEIQYVTEKSQIASTKYEVGENPSSIYTKLNKYPYEFEINSSLQLASINGVKLANNTKLIRKVISEFRYIARTDAAVTPYYGTKTFDIKEIIPNYDKLTKDNFCIQANDSNLTATNDPTTPDAGHATFTILSYEDGIITIELSKGVRNNYAADIGFSLIAFYIE